MTEPIVAAARFLTERRVMLLVAGALLVAAIFLCAAAVLTPVGPPAPSLPGPVGPHEDDPSPRIVR